jgi:NitT/TauT family transport system substrate-binding protein
MPKLLSMETLANIALLLFVLCPGQLACRRDSHVPSRMVRIVLTADPITWLPIRIAQTLGYYRDEGLEVSLSDAAGLSKGMEALLGGSADVTAGGTTQAIQIAAEGREVTCFLILSNRPATTLAVAPAMNGKIHGVADLKKHTVGVSSPGSPTHQFLNFLLITHGMSSDDVSVVAVGTGATSLAALEHGKVDAAVLVGGAGPAFEHRHPGQPFLADVRTAEGARQVFGSDQFPVAALIAQQNWLKNNSDTARRVVRAVKRAMEWTRTHSAEEVRQMIPEETRSPDAESDLLAIRQVQSTTSPDGTMPVGAAELLRKFTAASSEKVRNARIDLSKVFINDFANVK